MNKELVNQLHEALRAKAKQRYPEVGGATIALRQSYTIGCLLHALELTADPKALDELTHHHRQTPETEETAA